MESTQELVALLRRRGTDLPGVEAKAAGGGIPKSLRETLSAFSNGTGGVVLLGLAESQGFAPAPGFDPRKIRDALANMCSDDLTPPVRAEIEIDDVDGTSVVRADVAELEPRHKPCFVTARGEYQGSYIRSGDGDRHLTEYEISQLHANRGQPDDDREPVAGATAGDLEAEAVTALLARVRLRQPRAFAGADDQNALLRLGVLVPVDGNLVPTLAGLLCLGVYPQQFYPQLNVTFIAIPGTAVGDEPAGAPRFLDNQSLDGSIAVMIQDAMKALIRNMSRQGRIIGAGREDAYDYPVDALREAVTNAVMHRDYSALSRGAQVQIEMYQDRLVVRSPGGLFGNVAEEDLGTEGVSSSRNALLARILQDVTLPGEDRVVCENRGTGIPAMIKVLTKAGMTVPRFDSTLSRFQLTIPRHALLDAPTLEWIASLHQPDLTDAQCMALALLRDGRSVSNQTLRGLGLDRHDATGALSGLVSNGLAMRQGGRRYATYVLLDDGANTPRQLALDVVSKEADINRLDSRLQQILGAFASAPVLRTADIMTATGLSFATVNRRINELIGLNLLDPTAPPQSKKRAYRLVVRQSVVRQSTGPRQL